MNTDMIKKIETVIQTERFKQDSFFMCGNSNADMPNETLLYAAEAYVDAAKKADGAVNAGIRERLIGELEAAIAAREARQVKVPGMTMADEQTEFLKKLLGMQDQL